MRAINGGERSLRDAIEPIRNRGLKRPG